MASTPESGFLAIADLTGSSSHGLGTVARCVTGRLATLEEIVDRQPFDHVGRRLAGSRCSAT